MRGSRRQQQVVWFTYRTEDNSHIDPVIVYSKPFKKRLTVSNTLNLPVNTTAGVFLDYDKYFTCYDMTFQLKEGALLYIDTEPQLETDGSLSVGEDGVPVIRPDYYIRRILRTKRGRVFRCEIRRIDDEDNHL